MLKELIEAYVKALVETEEDLLDEFSGAGAVAGMSLPVGASPEPVVKPFSTKKKRKK